MMRLRLLLLCALLVGTVSTASLAHEGEHEPSLLVYSTVTDLLAGDVEVGVTIPEMQQQLETFQPGWAVVGVGTTTQPNRNGELMPSGNADDLNYWWVDPSSETMASLVNLAAIPPLPATTTELKAATPAAVSAIPDFEPEFPFIALSVADPAEALTYQISAVENLTEWLISTLAETEITVAGLQITGDFGAVSTTVGYNLPPEGIDTSQGTYSSTDHFHFIDYPDPAVWTMHGFYVTDPSLDGLVTAAGTSVHLHGYQPEIMLGGHIASAAVASATLTVYPLDQVVQLRGDNN